MIQTAASEAFNDVYQQIEALEEDFENKIENEDANVDFEE
jgi:hypothetical protein